MLYKKCYYPHLGQHFNFKLCEILLPSSNVDPGTVDVRSTSWKKHHWDLFPETFAFEEYQALTILY